VSTAKSITQANRSKKVAAFKMDDRQHLEPKVPTDYNERLRNRTYKRMVIDCIIASLLKMLDLKVCIFVILHWMNFCDLTCISHLQGGRSFIVDYVDCPERFFFNEETQKLDREYMQLPPVSQNMNSEFFLLYETRNNMTIGWSWQAIFSTSHASDFGIKSVTFSMPREMTSDFGIKSVT
jgi:hypothetical protein